MQIDTMSRGLKTTRSKRRTGHIPWPQNELLRYQCGRMRPCKMVSSNSKSEICKQRTFYNDQTPFPNPFLNAVITKIPSLFTSRGFVPGQNSIFKLDRERPAMSNEIHEQVILLSSHKEIPAHDLHNGFPIPGIVVPRIH